MIRTFVTATVLVSALLAAPLAEAQSRPTSSKSAGSEQSGALPWGALRRFGTCRFQAGRAVTGLAFSANGARLASQTAHGVLIWSVSTGRLLGRISGALAGPDCIRPDGTAIAVLDPPRVAGRPDPRSVCRIVAIPTGRELRRFGRPTEAATAATWRSDGKTLAVGFAKGGMSVIDLQAGGAGREFAPPVNLVKRGSRTIQYPAGRVTQIVMSQDGKVAVTRHGSRRLVVAIWDVPNGRLRHRQGTTADCDAVQLTPDGKTLWVAGHGGTRGKVNPSKYDIGPAADLAAPLRFALATGGKAITQRAAFSRDGKWLVQTTVLVSDLRKDIMPCETLVADLATGTVAPLGPERTGLRAAALVDNGKWVATAGVEGTIDLWDRSAGKARSGRQGRLGPLYALAVSRDERLLAVAGHEKTVHLFEIASGRHVRSYPIGRKVFGMAFSADGKRLAIAFDTAGTVMDLASGALPSPLPDAPRPSLYWSLRHRRPVVWSADEKHYVISEAKGLAVYNAQTHALGEAGRDAIVAAAGRAVPRYLGVGLTPSQRMRELRKRFQGTSIQAVEVGGTHPCEALSPDGKAKVLAVGDCVVVLDAVLGKETRRLAPKAGLEPGRDRKLYHHVAFTPDGTRVIGIQDVEPDPTKRAQAGFFESSDQIIRVWDAASGAEQARLSGHRGNIVDFTFAEGGRVLLTAGADGTVLMWDLARRRKGTLPDTLAELCDALVGDDGVRAIRTMRVLADRPTKVAEVVRHWLTDAQQDATVAEHLRGIDSADLAPRLRALKALSECRTTRPACQAMLTRALLDPEADVVRVRRIRMLVKASIVPMGEALNDRGRRIVAREKAKIGRIIQLLRWTGDDGSQKRLRHFADRLPAVRGGDKAVAAVLAIQNGTHRDDLPALPKVSQTQPADAGLPRILRADTTVPKATPRNRQPGKGVDPS